MTNINDRISIQVGLSGYSFKIESEGVSSVSGWLPAESFFQQSQMQKRYSDVSLSLFTPYCTLVPRNFFRPEVSKELLSDVVALPESAVVDFVELPEYDAVMVFSPTVGGTLHKVISESVLKMDGSRTRLLPEMYHMLMCIRDLSEYNRIVASYMDGVLYLVISQGKTLLLCNMYTAQDFVTAQYFIFLAMKKLQLNPEVSAICFRTPLDDEQQMSLYRYFKSVELL